MARLVASPIGTIEASTFADDLLGREAFGTSLTGLVAGQQGPLVMALDAPWGEGKTTFVHMWRHQLEGHGIEAIYFDAFKHDYADDPFLPLVGEVLSFSAPRLAADHDAPDLGDAVRRSAGRVGARFLGWATRIGLHHPTDPARSVSAIAEDVIADQLAEFTSQSDDLDHFKAHFTALCRKLARDSGEPVVYIIDELDRCKPDFAVTLLDRINHVLDVPGVVFLLVVHREQLEESIRCSYGAGIDASEYLSKFVHIWCSLPQQSAEGFEDQYAKYCHALFEAHELDCPDDERTLRKVLPYVCRVARLSLRQMERVFSNLAVFYSTTAKDQLRMPALACVVAVLRIRDFATFRMLRDQQLSFEQLRARTRWLFRRTDENEWILGDLIVWLEYCLAPPLEFANWNEERKARFGRSLRRHDMQREDILPYLCALFEMFRTE